MIASQRTRRVLSGLVVGGGGGVLAAAVYYCYSKDEGTRRAIKAYTAMVPVVLHYRAVEARHKVLLLGEQDNSNNSKDWEALDETYAARTVKRLGELQGMYCKYGQTAAGFTNTLGDAWIQELRKLENDVPPRPVDVVYETIQQETGGKKVEETFSYIDPTPLGSASIGQVHRAILKEGQQQEVAVKIQYPEAQQLFQDDIHTIRTFCEALAPEHVVLLDSIEKQNAAELDYEQEVKNLLEIRSNMEQLGFSPNEVVVPRPIQHLSTKRMLVMELLPGKKLIDGVRDYYSKWAIDHGTTLHDLEVEMRAKIEREGIPAKYDGPSGWQLSWYSRYLRLRDGIVNIGVASYNGTVGRIASNTSLEYQQSSIPPNTPRIVDTLMRVHGYQLLQDGVFNSGRYYQFWAQLLYPHRTTLTVSCNGAFEALKSLCGNFLLLPDGRIGLIDYGATKRLDRNERLSLCLLYAALYRKDEERLFQLCDIAGYKSKYGRRDVLMKLIQFGYDSWANDVTEGKNMQQFIDELKEQDPWEEIPDNFVMAQFLSTRLRSVALGMNHPVRCSTWWGPIAEEVLRREGHPYESWTYEKMLEHKPELNMQKYKFS
eukprot:scaffold9646_cov133-Cylindrotheca_fusiformis.AAC.4